METEMNGFELHNIKHTSASSINKWADAPDVWIADKLLKRKFPTGAAAWRGILVEDAVANVLSLGWDIQEAIDQSITRYNMETKFNPGADVEKNREAIAPMVELALEALEPYGQPEFDDGKQKKIELLCNGDGWQLPVIGFTDFFYPDKGITIDLKTTFRAPSKLSAPHNRQAVIYQKALGNHEIKFLYVTPKKYEMLDPHDIDQTLAEIKTILNRQEQFLKISDDKQTLANIIPLNIESFYWNGAENIRSEIYGI